MTEVPGFLSTHPSTEGRITNLIKLEQQNSGDKKPLPNFLQDYVQTKENMELRN
jgi:predicted Zn-dependent protease